MAFSLLLDQDPKTTLFEAGEAKRAKKSGRCIFSLSFFPLEPTQQRSSSFVVEQKKGQREANSNFLFWRGGEEGRFLYCRYTSYSGGEQKHDSNLQSVVQTLQYFFFSVCAKGQCLSISPKNPSSCRSFQIDCLTSPTSSSSCTESGRRVLSKFK